MKVHLGLSTSKQRLPHAGKGADRRGMLGLGMTLAVTHSRRNLIFLKWFQPSEERYIESQD